ncbi:acetyl-CoA synthetase-like protein [Aureobasidium sp. EXF-3400]|nr:acetyl-CoA synthetase-like protein [Aureobasidium sp. EXF-12344]KAI4770657.1 acetyl-CoA synthetase-like protein [Aureobasidium sp. EXF-3400]
MAVKHPRSVLFEALRAHDQGSIAIVDSASGKCVTYASLLKDVSSFKHQLLRDVGRDDIFGERVAFIVENSYNYTVTLLAIIACNAIAVPLAISFPASELRHIINLAQANVLLASDKFLSRAKEMIAEGLDSSPSLHNIQEILARSQETDMWYPDVLDTAQAGIMLFTSGTTAKPKGVMLSDATLSAQAQSLMEAWSYRPSDHLLHVLPLHHINGIVNAILTPLLSGGCIEFMYPFDAKKVWRRLAAPFLEDADVFIGGNMSPYGSPISPITLQPAGREAVSRQHLRLTISGSAALPKPIRDEWTALSGGNILLERYGMTEVGMALSCGLDDQDRIDGSVGWPLPSVQVRLVETDVNGVQTVIELGQESDPISGAERQGEIQLCGPTVFDGYWDDPLTTAKEFTQDGWFKTGDIAIRRLVSGSGRGQSGSWAQGPAYFVQGRQSADIIKTGGEKVSALEIEREILSLPEVREVAVLGLPSQMWGQKVVAVVVLSNDMHGKLSWELTDLRRSLRSRLVGYKIPQDLVVVPTIKRNAMGKINKKELAHAVFGDVEKIRRRSIVVREQRILLRQVVV